MTEEFPLMKCQIEFDDERAKALGYDPDELRAIVDFGFVDKGFIRTSEGCWVENPGIAGLGHFGANINILARKKWFRDTVKTWLFFDEEHPEGEDVLAVLEKRTGLQPLA